MYAYDFNRIPGPSPQEVKDNAGDGILIYGTGAQQSAGYVKAHEDAGLHVVRIWEHNTDSILGGYNYGVAECQVFERNNPPGLVYLACDLNDGALAGRDVTPFCRGWCDTTRESAVGLYGSDDAIREGINANIAKLTHWWGVVNWIQHGWSNNDQRNIDFWTVLGAHLVQLIGSPIASTDQNLILQSNWWTTGTAPAPVKPKESDAMIVIFPTPYATSVAWLMFGDFKAQEWIDSGPSDETFGIPNAAVNWNKQAGRGFDFKFLDAATALNLAAAHKTTALPASGLTEADVEQALRNVLHNA